MRKSLLVLVLVAVAVAVVTVVAGCSSGSSGGTPGPSASGGASARPGVIDRGGVDAVLSEVLSGLAQGTGIAAGTSLSEAAKQLSGASTDLAEASQELTPAPQGVPDATAAPVATGLIQVSEELDQAATCLNGQVGKKRPATHQCLPPLRAAQQNDATLSRDLISLAAYGTRTPTTFEHLLVKALHGGQ